MTISYTALLGLAQPVTGTETGQWGTVVNDEITALLEDAVANAASISVTAGNVTLSTTNGSSNQARMSTLIITGTPGTTRNVVAPSQAKIYVVINQSDGAVVIKGAATSGVTIGAGQTAQVAWNGSDFVEIGNYVHGNFVVNGNLSVNGDSTLGNAGADTTTINGQVIAANSNISKTTTLSASAPALAWIKGATYTDTGTAGGTTQALAPFTVFSTPTLSTSNIVTYTDAATVYIAGAPAAAGSATITNPYSLYVAAGNAYFGASVSATTLDLTNLEVTNIKAKDGTASMTLADTTGNVTFSKATVIETTDNTNAALRVTQLGTGNAILVEDSANPDSTPFVVTSAGDVGIGTDSPASATRLTIDYPGFVQIVMRSSGTDRISLYGDAGVSAVDAKANPLALYAGSAERARIDLSGTLILRQSSNAANTSVSFNTTVQNALTLDSSGNLTLGGAAAGTNRIFNINGVVNKASRIAFQESGVDRWLIGNGAASENGNFEIYDATNANNFILTRSGNLGLGVTPSAWASTHKAYQLPGGGGLYNNGADGYLNLANNFYYDGADWRRVTAAPASTYLQSSSGHLWGYVGTGTANSVCGFPSAQMALDTSGNLGLGVTPSAWRTQNKTLQIGATGVVTAGSAATSLMDVGSNWFYNSTSAFIYIASDYATNYRQASGAHAWYTAASGTAGNVISFTQAMTLDANGSLVVGGTTVVTNNGGVTATTTASGSIATSLAMRNAGTANGSGSYLNFRGVSNTGAEHDYCYLAMVADDTTAKTGSIRFSTTAGSSPVERARITSGGDLQIANGNLVMSTSGKGIDFSATSSGTGTMTSELLADYEEGTWTPTATFATPGTVSTSLAVGLYTKVGNVVTAVGRIAITKGTASGNLVLGGLPFASNNTTSYQVAGTLSTDTFGVAGTLYQMLLASNSTVPEALAVTQSTGITNAVTASDFYATAGTLRFAFTYQI